VSVDRSPQRWCLSCSHQRARHWGGLGFGHPRACLRGGCGCPRFNSGASRDAAAVSAVELDQIVEISVSTSWCRCGNVFRETEWHREDCPLFAEWREELEASGE
jgi:hypothetical protein